MLIYCREKDKISTLNEYFPFPLESNHTLLTTRHGGWLILSNKEYGIFKLDKLNQNSELFKNLE